MQLSVLMSVYKNDNPDHFMDAYNSIIDQTQKADQIVLVRDGRVSQELQNRLDKISAENELLLVVELDYNVGLSKALNIGLKHCDYEFIARMDSDDISFPYRFQKQLEFLSKNKDISLLGGWYEQYDSEMIHKIAERKVPENNERIKQFSQTRTPFNHVTAVFRKDHVLEIGGYPSIKGRLEDWWLALRLLKHGYKMHNLQEYLVKVRGGEDFLSRRGGVEYLKWEIKNLFMMHQEDLIDTKSLFKNLMIRSITRLTPPLFRNIIYKQIRSFKNY